MLAFLVLLVGPSTASAHTPIEIQVLEPSAGQVLQSTTIRVSMRARSLDPAVTSVQVQIKLDETWFDPRKGTLSIKPPVFGGLVLSNGQTKQVRIERVEPGAHRLSVIYDQHVGEAAQTKVVEFKVAIDAVSSRRRASTFFFIVLGTLVIGAAALQLSWRRRMSRS